MNRQLEYLPLAQLEADPANPKAHDTDVIAESLQRFGYVEPIVRDDRTGYIVSGHGRTESLRAAELADPTSPPEGVNIAEDGSWLVPVLTGWASANDQEAKAALVALNRTGQVGGWDDVALLQLLEGLADDDAAGLAGVGYSDQDIHDLHRLMDGSPDLDELADSWDGSGMPTKAGGGGGGQAATVLLSGDVAQRWTEHRVAFDSDEEALAYLLDRSGS